MRSTSCPTTPALLFLLSPSLLIGSAGEQTLTQMPEVRVVGWTIDDSAPGGAGNGGWHPGEAITLAIQLINRGAAPARNVSAQLFEAVDHPDIEILDKVATWPDLLARGTPAFSDAPHLLLSAAATRPCRWDVRLRLEIVADGYAASHQLTLDLADPRHTDLKREGGRPIVYGADPFDNLGQIVSAGDLDGDGFDDLIASARGGDGPGNSRGEAGEVVVLYGGPDRRNDIDLAVPPTGIGIIYGADSFDSIVGLGSGDLDGDGYGDLILGAAGANGPAGRSRAGKVVVLYGGPARISTVDLASPPANAAFIYGADALDNLGSAGTSSDLDGDGFDDLILGVHFADGPGNGRPDAGEVVVIHGSASRLGSVDLASPPAGVVIIYGEDADDQAGTSIAAGDLDGDGHEDLILTMLRADGPGNTRTDAGGGAVIYGGASRLTSLDLASPPANVAFVFGEEAFDLLGATASAGDLDADGRDEMALGAYATGGIGDTRPSSGEAVVIYGRKPRLTLLDLAAPSAEAAFVYGTDGGDYLMPSGAADLDGDGFDDLILGARYADGPGNARPSAGEAFVLYGGPSRWTSLDLASPPSSAALISGANATDYMASSMASGDLDGDGLADLILGALNGGSSNIGRVQVIPGQVRSRYRHDPDPYAFIDATSGTNLGLACDDCGAGIPIGFPFDFYGRSYTDVTVSSNGYLTFGGPGDRLPVACLPDRQEPLNIIAVLWDDWNPAAGGGVFSKLEGTAPNRRLTIEWAGVPRYPAAGAASFEVTLFESSNQILFQYQDVLVGTVSDNGATAVVGVENATGRNGTPFSCFDAGIANGTAVRWRRFSSPTTVFSDDAEMGIAGWTATGLWHQVSATTCPPDSRSGLNSWYYGQDATCDFDTGTRNSGSLTSPLIPALPQDAALHLWTRRETENFPPYDLSFVEAEGDVPGFSTLRAITDETNAWRNTDDFLLPDPTSGTFTALDLSPYAGQDLRLRFSFDTLDQGNNAFFGWMVDDITIDACPVFGAGGGPTAAVEARATALTDSICETEAAALDALGSWCAACSVPLSFQWQENGAAIPGATSVGLTIPPGHAPGAFDYTVAIGCATNAACAAESGPARVSVTALPAAVGPTLDVVPIPAANPTSLRFHWADVAGAAGYVLFSDTLADGPFATEAGSGSTGSTGITIGTPPGPPGSIAYFLVAGQNAVCGAGPKR